MINQEFFMKKTIKQFILSACTVILMSNANFLPADITTDTEKLLNWAENTYPDFFPNHQVTQSIEPWLYRYYPDTGIYAGVNKSDNSVYVLGGPYGTVPTRIAGLPELISGIVDTGGNSSIPACNTANAPAGMSFSQSGNVVNVTTGGACIPLPANNNFCSTRRQSTATGISVITSTAVVSAPINGITIDIPGIPNPFQSAAEGFANSKHCTIHVPADDVNLIINTNVCFDITLALSGITDVPGVTITPPVTLALNSTTTNQVVPNCFATDANSIYNAVTNESWKNVGGRFVNSGSKR